MYITWQRLKNLMIETKPSLFSQISAHALINALHRKCIPPQGHDIEQWPHLKGCPSLTLLKSRNTLKTCFHCHSFYNDFKPPHRIRTSLSQRQYSIYQVEKCHV